ncbi:MAG TPA: hypothetical protein VHH36_01535 [Candidatus Thermoplasmatota archaeon]|nr:hypothetical protein [Candidatus Thermoplasmatota archaeon]
MGDPGLTRVILAYLRAGRTTDEILREAGVSQADIQAAAADALAALEGGRLETREERIARVRKTHPRAFDPWHPWEEERLREAWRRGDRFSDMARALGRPPGAVRARLEKMLGPEWRAGRP